MAQGDDVGAQFAADVVYGTAAEAAAEVAAVVGLVFKELQGRVVDDVVPVDAAREQPFAERGDGPEKLALLDGEGADGEIDGGAFLQQQQGLEHGDRVLAAGDGHGHAIAFANHFEAGNRLADFAQQDLFKFQTSIIRCAGESLD